MTTPTRAPQPQPPPPPPPATASSVPPAIPGTATAAATETPATVSSGSATPVTLPEPPATTRSRARYPGVRAVQFVRGRVRPQPRHARSSTGLHTPLLLRLAMALVCVTILLFALAVNLGVTRNDRAVATVGEQATRGITLAQQIKLNLAELDEIAVHDLVDGASVDPFSGFPADYSAKRRELHASLVLAASEVPSSLAYRQRLVNIDYALAHYHALLRDSFAARQRGEAGPAALIYEQAHTVMQGTLLPQADSFDKANTYVLNGTYERHKADAASTTVLILAAWVALLGTLIAVQVLLARKFRRVVNLALAAATLAAGVTGLVVLNRLDDSSSNLTTAREGAFDAVHVLARARATVVTAWQAEGQLLLDLDGPSTPTESADPADAPRVEGGFAAEAANLFRVPFGGDIMAAARNGEVPEGSGGYLATVVEADVSEGGDRAASEALVAFGRFLQADAELRQLVAAGNLTAARARHEDGAAFNQLAAAIDEARSIDQATFDDRAEAAADATSNLGVLNTVAAVLMAALVLFGLYQRLREYRP